MRFSCLLKFSFKESDFLLRQFGFMVRWRHARRILTVKVRFHASVGVSASADVSIFLVENSIIVRQKAKNSTLIRAILLSSFRVAHRKRNGCVVWRLPLGCMSTSDERIRMNDAMRCALESCQECLACTNARHGKTLTLAFGLP